jgi:hypothetical protein
MSVTELITALGMIAAGVGVFYAALQLRMSQKASREEFLLHMFELLQHFNPVHLRLQQGKWTDDESEEEWMELNRYMGLIEHIKLLIDDGFLNVRTVDRLFSHRVHAIVSNPSVRRRNLEERRDIWNDFHELWRLLQSQPSYKAYEAFALARATRDESVTG